MKKLKCGADITFDDLQVLNKNLSDPDYKHPFKEGDKLIACLNGYHKVYVSGRIDQHIIFHRTDELPTSCPIVKAREDKQKMIIAGFSNEKVMTFETLDLDKNNTREAVKKAKEIIYNPDIRILILFGSVGLGKTHITKALITELKEILPQLSTGYFTSQMLYYKFKDFENGNIGYSYFEDLYKISLIAIDDLGEEKQTDKLVFNTNFKEFLDLRKGKIIITTNLVMGRRGRDEGNTKTILGRYGVKIWDRLKEKTQYVLLKGESQRR